MLDGYVGASSIFATSRLQGPWFNLEHGLGCCHFVFCLISQCLDGFSPGSFERGLPTLNFPRVVNLCTLSWTGILSRVYFHFAPGVPGIDSGSTTNTDQDKKKNY